VKREERCGHLWGTYQRSLTQLCKTSLEQILGANLKHFGGNVSHKSA